MMIVTKVHKSTHLYMGIIVNLNINNVCINLYIWIQSTLLRSFYNNDDNNNSNSWALLLVVVYLNHYISYSMNFYKYV